MAVDTQQIRGFDDLAAKLREIPKALRKRVLRNALAAGARLVRDAARASAPVLQQSVPYRTPGLVRKSIVVRTSKAARRAGDVGVFVNVRPARGAKSRRLQVFTNRKRLVSRAPLVAAHAGARRKTDPFYWRFLEFGTKKMAARPFLSTAASRLPAALAVFQDQVGRWIAKTNATGQIQP
jgi:HK97 gp10 family phage protein